MQFLEIFISSETIYLKNSITASFILSKVQVLCLYLLAEVFNEHVAPAVARNFKCQFNRNQLQCHLDGWNNGAIFEYFLTVEPRRAWNLENLNTWDKINSNESNWFEIFFFIIIFNLNHIIQNNDINNNLVSVWLWAYFAKVLFICDFTPLCQWPERWE